MNYRLALPNAICLDVLGFECIIRMDRKREPLPKSKQIFISYSRIRFYKS